MIVARLAEAAQLELVAEVSAAARVSPWYVPTMPRTGAPFRVSCMNFGSLGWCSDARHGYRYAATHPDGAGAWLPIPATLLALWREHVSPDPRLAPECCLVNRYGRSGRLGMHVDADEAARDVPVLSVSIGDTAVFRLGGMRRQDPSRVFDLHSGDVFVLAGEDRQRYHGVDKIRFRSSKLLASGGRLSFTLRRVTERA